MVKNGKAREEKVQAKNRKTSLTEVKNQIGKEKDNNHLRRMKWVSLILMTMRTTE